MREVLSTANARYTDDAPTNLVSPLLPLPLAGEGWGRARSLGVARRNQAKAARRRLRFNAMVCVCEVALPPP